MTATSANLSSTAHFTPDDLLHLPDAVDFELVGGKLVERSMGMVSSRVAARILGILFAFLADSRLGELFGPDASYQCFKDDPQKVRRPDVSFILHSRLPNGRVPEGHCPVAPDLAVEVLSPNDLAYDVDAKIQEYLSAGVRLIWIVYPDTRKVQIYRPRLSKQGHIAELADDETIKGEDVLPGFSCGIDAFFLG